MTLFSSELEFVIENSINMNKLIIDVDKEKIFLMIITNNNIYNITHDNTKINYEKLTLIIIGFLEDQNLKINDINKIYVNVGSGSFSGIRNSLSIVKAFNVAKKIEYYCYSLDDFKGEKNITYENIPNLCEKYKIKKNLINSIYMS